MVHEQAPGEKPEMATVSQEQIVKIREAFALRIEDIVTNPKMGGAGFSTGLPEDIRQGRKIRGNTTLRDALIAIGQDFRLTYDQIEFIKTEFLE